MRLPLRLPPRLLRPQTASTNIPTWSGLGSASTSHPALAASTPRYLASVISAPSDNIWFTSTPPNLSFPSANNPLHPSANRPPDERTIQLRQTVRTLHAHLPQILQSPLPAEILSPQITLHLFPTTHPHLPTVSGRIAYGAALRTAPVAWGRVPFVGNSIEVLEERMVRNGRYCGKTAGESGIRAGSGTSSSNGSGSSEGDEKLIVKWRTRRGGTLDAALTGAKKTAGRRNLIAGEHSQGEDAAGDETFCGMFVFEFDEQGRIGKHVIENTEESGRWDRMTRVVSVTDWLLSRFNGRASNAGLPALALCEERPTGRRIHLVDRRGRGGGSLGLD